MMSTDHHDCDLQVSNSQFLDELARALPGDSLLWVTAFIGNPDGHPGWHGHEYDGSEAVATRVDSYRRQNAYFSTAALRYVDEPAEENGATIVRPVLRRRKKNFSRMLALVVDDANPQDLEAPASWVLSTSPGKRQVGFFLDGDDPDCAEIRIIDALVTRMAAMGLIGGDKSGNNAVRYVRLPQGENQKPRSSGPFTVKLIHWAPEVRYTLTDAAAALGIDLDEIRRLADAPQAQSGGGIQGNQDEKLEQATHNILAGTDLHDSVNVIAASLIASGTHPGTVVNHLRALMSNSQAPRNERWTARYNDISRSVETAFQKFRYPSSAPAQIDTSTGEIREPLFRSAGDLLSNLRPIEFVVDGYLETDALSMIFGPSGSGKSFVALTMACCVATGTPWFGMAVRQGPVFVLVGEGLNGYGRRLKAWSVGNNVSLDEAPLFVSRHAVNLTDQHAALEVAAEIDQMITAYGVKPALIIPDTLARNFGDGDENSTQDMSRFVANIDLYLKHRYNANILLVHHSGHEGERARGSSALKAALDQEFKVSGASGRVKFECTKMKDAETPAYRTFKLSKITIGADNEGEEITGAVLVTDGNPLEFHCGHLPDGRAITAASVIKLFIDGAASSYEMLMLGLQCGRSTARTAVANLQKAGLLVKHAGKKWFELSEGAINQARAAGWIPAGWQQDANSG